MVNETPGLAHVITTFFDSRYVDVGQREAVAYGCARAIRDLVIPTGRTYWCDDHSPDYPSGLSLPIVPAARGVGASLNVGFQQAKLDGYEYVLYAVDDWMPLQALDLTGPLNYMEADPSIASIRLGPPHPDLTGRVQHTDEWGWYLDLDSHHFVVSHRPTIWRIDAVAEWGWWPENCSALVCEDEMNRRFLSSLAIDYDRVLLWLPDMWNPIYTTSLSDLNPVTR